MLVFLANGNHGMFAGRHFFLPDRPIASYIPWIHTGIIWTLQATLVTIAFIELPGTIGARCHPAKFERLIGQSVSEKEGQKGVTDQVLEPNSSKCWVSFVISIRICVPVRFRVVRVHFEWYLRLVTIVATTKRPEICIKCAPAFSHAHPHIDSVHIFIYLFSDKCTWGSDHCLVC